MPDAGPLAGCVVALMKLGRPASVRARDGWLLKEG